MTGDTEERIYRKRQAERFPQHACELPPHPDRVYPLLPPNASCWMHLQRRVTKLVVGWRKWRPLRDLRLSNFAIETEQARQAHSRHWWVVHPHSRLFAVWQLVMLFSISCYFLVAPLHHAFINPYRFMQQSVRTADGSKPFLNVFHPEMRRYKRNLDAMRHPVEFILDSCNFFFYLHVMVQFVTGYYDASANEMVLKPSRIAGRYLCTWFIPDALSCINYREARSDLTVHRQADKDMYEPPIDALVVLMREAVLLLRVLRLHYLITYARAWTRMVRCRPIVTKAALYVTCFASFVWWSTYASYKFPLMIRGETLLQNDSQSWLSDPELAFFDVTQDHIRTRQVLLCLYRVMSMASRAVPNMSSERLRLTPEDVIHLLVVMWIGMGFKVVLFGIILQYVETNNSAQVELEKVRSQVRTFMRHKDLPPPVRHKMMLFYAHSYNDRFFNERAILSQMPPSIREGVRRASSRNVIAASALFRGVPKSLVYNIVSELKEELYLPYDVVYAAGQLARHLFFLDTGTVGVFLATGEEVGHLEDGACFGEMGLMLREHRSRHVESVVALEVCEVYRLDRQSFERLVRPLPRLYNRLRAAAMLRAAEVAPMEMDTEDWPQSPT